MATDEATRGRVDESQCRTTDHDEPSGNEHDPGPNGLGENSREGHRYRQQDEAPEHVDAEHTALHALIDVLVDARLPYEPEDHVADPEGESQPHEDEEGARESIQDRDGPDGRRR